MAVGGVDPLRRSMQMQVMRVLLPIGMKAARESLPPPKVYAPTAGGCGEEATALALLVAESA